MKTPAWILVSLMPLFAACGTERIVEKPVVVEVPGPVQWREVPADLLLECVKSSIPDGLTYGEALEAWAEDRAQIDVCNGQLQAIGSLGQ